RLVRLETAPCGQNRLTSDSGVSATSWASATCWTGTTACRSGSISSNGSAPAGSRQALLLRHPISRRLPAYGGTAPHIGAPHRQLPSSSGGRNPQGDPALVVVADVIPVSTERSAAWILAGGSDFRWRVSGFVDPVVEVVLPVVFEQFDGSAVLRRQRCLRPMGSRLDEFDHPLSPG